MTSADGAFSVTAPQAGTWVLDVSRIGYAAWRSEPFDIAPDEWIEVEIRLGVEAIPLDPIRVIASARSSGAEFRRRMLTQSGTGRFIGRDRIERATSLRTSDLLRAVPGLTLAPIIDPRFPGMGSARYVIRGRQGCPATVFVDGLRMSQGELATIDDFTSPRMLEGVEIYAAGEFAPSQYRADDGCAVVLFWTRTPEPTASRWSWKRLGAALAVVGLMIGLGR
jgi:hypothetical protein